MSPPLDLTDPETRTALGWAREKARCEKDFLYLAEKYLRIKSKEVIGFPTLRLRRVQQILWGKILDQWKRTGWVRQIWGKGRQVGASTLGRGFSFQQTAFNDNRNAFLLTHDEPTSYKLFDVDKIFYDNLPPQLQPAKKYDPKHKMTFSGRNSEVVVGHARNFHVGASQMNHFVHMTEVARYPNAEEVQGSLFPTISAAKGADCSVVIIESTSRFGGTWFKDFAEAARKGESAYEFTFIPAHLHEPYNIPPPRGFQLTLDEKEIKRKHGVSENFLAWRRQEMREYKNNPALFNQEFALSWEESWILPQGTLRMFKDEFLKPLQQGLRPGKRMTPTSTGLIEQLGGPVEVWEAPEPDVYYDLGVDISEGRTEEADWSVGVVIRRDTLKQVARYRLHINPASVEYVDLNYWLGMAYNAAQINPDITGGWGNYLLSELQARSYPNIWHWRRRDDAHERVSSRLGFYFTKRDKAILVSTAVALVERGEVEIADEILFDEMRSYLNIGLDEWAAAPGTHDDCLKPGTLIRARTGYTEIERISVGDEVLTHRGRYRRVTRLIRKDFDGEFYRADYANLPTLDLSYNHPLYATWRDTPSKKQARLFGRGYNARAWILPGRWHKPKHRCLSVIPPQEPKTAMPFTADDHYFHHPMAKGPSVREIPADGRFARILGRFLADGHANRPRPAIPQRQRDRAGRYMPNGHRSRTAFYRVNLSFNADDDSMGGFVNDFRSLGLSPQVTRQPDTRCVVVTVQSKLLWSLLRQCYSEQGEKIVPSYAYALGGGLLGIMLSEWLAGDGSRVNGEIIGATTSRSLALAMWEIAWQTGRYAAIQTTDRHRYERKTKRQYWVRIKDKRPPQGHSRQVSLFEVASATKSITAQHYCGPVYNLEVEEDESFVAEGIAVHNCVSAWMLALLAARDERYGMDMTPPQREEPVVEKPWAIHDIDADLSGDTAPEGLVLSPWRV